jgi:hypothetical protein
MPFMLQNHSQEFPLLAKLAIQHDAPAEVSCARCIF